MPDIVSSKFQIHYLYWLKLGVASNDRNNSLIKMKSYCCLIVMSRKQFMTDKVTHAARNSGPIHLPKFCPTKLQAHSPRWWHCIPEEKTRVTGYKTCCLLRNNHENCHKTLNLFACYWPCLVASWK